MLGPQTTSTHARRCRVRRTPIESAKLKLSLLFELGGIYGIDDALQNRSCPMN